MVAVAVTVATIDTIVAHRKFVSVRFSFSVSSISLTCPSNKLEHYEHVAGQLASKQQQQQHQHHSERKLVVPRRLYIELQVGLEL